MLSKAERFNRVRPLAHLRLHLETEKRGHMKKQWFFFWVGILLLFSKTLLATDPWEATVTYAWKVFDYSLSLNERYENYAQMLQKLYQYGPGIRRVHVDKRAKGFGTGETWRDAFHTITEAIQALGHQGGWIWVAEGEYEETLHLPSKVLLFGGFSGVETELADRDIFRHPTVLRGNGTTSVVFMEHQTVLDGFVITQGGGDKGGGILTGGWLAIIRNNIIRENHVSWSGGGLLVLGGTPAQGSIGSVPGVAPIVERNIFAHNSATCGSGLATRHSRVLFVNNTVVDNFHGERSRGYEVVSDAGEEPTVLNSIFWNNGDDIYNQFGVTGNAILIHCCIKDEVDFGPGVIHENPLFTNPSVGDYSLQSTSPCIDKGIWNISSLKDPDGTVPDMGAIPTFIHNKGLGTAVTFQSSPISGMPISIDHGFYLTPKTVFWNPGYNHPVRAGEFVWQDWGKAYVFQGWDDTTARVRWISATGTPATYTAHYRSQIALDIVNAPEGVPVQGQGWYDSGSSVTVSAPQLWDTGTGIRYVFHRWEGKGSGSYFGTKAQFTVTLNNPIVEKVFYKTQYRLETVILPDTAVGVEIQKTPEGTFYDSGTLVHLSAKSVNPYYKFEKWEGDVEGSNAFTSILMNQPKRVIARFSYMPHPPFVSGIPDTTILEDQTVIIPWDWFAPYIHDANDAFSSLKLTFDSDGHTWVMRDALNKRIQIFPPANWYGKSQIFVWVQDPMGATDVDTFEVEVQPLSDDPPGPFDLLTPEDHSEIYTDRTAIQFQWTVSYDPDPQDTVTYRLYFASHPESLSTSSYISTTEPRAIVSLLPMGTYYWAVEAMDCQGHTVWSSSIRQFEVKTGVDGHGPSVPTQFHVSENFPNPFNPETCFEIALPKSSEVRFTVFDMRGVKVYEANCGKYAPGVHRILWHGKTDAGEVLPSGIYTVRFDLGGHCFIRKVVLTR